jgi:hypothetical protein
MAETAAVKATFTIARLRQNQVNEQNLAGAQQPHGQPGKELTRPERPLPCFGEAELKSESAEVEDISIAQAGLSSRLAIDADFRISDAFDEYSAVRVPEQACMLIPDSGVLAAKHGGRASADEARQSRQDNGLTGTQAAQHGETDHQIGRWGTWMESPG